MKIGIDIHGCIDLYPQIFSKLSQDWIEKGHEVFILTGQEWDNAKLIVDKAGVHYNHYFSIIDHHRKLETPMYNRSDKCGWWMKESLWMRSKGDYALCVGLDLHFDDDADYAKYFPKTCTFVLVPKNNFDMFYYKILSRRSK